MKIIRWIFAALTMISSIITFTMLPETIPVHFDFYGNPDRYGSRFEMLLLPVILVIVILFSDSLGAFLLPYCYGRGGDPHRVLYLLTATLGGEALPIYGVFHAAGAV